MSTVSGEMREAQPNPLSRKITKILETRLDTDRETLDALKELSTFFSENNLRSRRNLRGELERRSLTTHQDFLCALGSVKDNLDAIHSSASTMTSACHDMMSRVHAHTAHTHALIAHASRLRADTVRLTVEQEVASAFLHTFQLTEAEMLALRGPSNSMSPTHNTMSTEFFSALQRVGTVHKHAQVLLQTHRQVAALDIMEQMALYQEAGLERLYRWAGAQCRVSGANQEISPLLTQAMAQLQERPVLFKYVLDEYMSARRAELVHGFIDAMTCGIQSSGTGGKSGRPIELHAHDPPRYVGDMLAWVHQAAPNEKESITTLLENCNNIDADAETRLVLSHISEGVTRPLSTRVEQVIMAESSATILYKLSNLLRFYTQTLTQMLGPGPLVSCLGELYELSHQTFITALTSAAAALCGSVSPAVAGSALTPPPALHAALNLLRETLQGGGMVEHRQDDLNQMVSVIVDPLVNALVESACPLSPADMAVYLLNSLHSLQQTLQLYEFTEHRLEMIQGQIDAQMDTLVSLSASAAVHKLGLSALYTTLQSATDDDMPKCGLNNFDRDTIDNFLTCLDTFLATPDSLQLPQTHLLLTSVLRGTVSSRCMEVIATVYTQLYTAVHHVHSGFTQPHQVMPKTPQQIRDLLHY